MQDDAKSQLSKMSGASNFDIVDSITKKADRKDGDETSSKYRNQKLTALQTKKQENEIGFLSEEEQWATIYRFNRTLYDKEAEILKKREFERKQKLKEELDQQVLEKQTRKQQQKLEEDAYYQNQLLQCQMFDKREQERIEAAKHLKMIEKQGRDQQIKENKKMRRIETKQEKQLDSYMITKVKEELNEESRFNQFKKEHQYQVMQKLLVENEERKIKQMNQQEQERQENIKLMDAYCRLLDQQEHERAKAIQERDAKIKQYQARALEIQEQELEKKLGMMEKRAQKYEQRKEKRIQELEKLQEQRKKQNKSEIKEFLFKQMSEKDQRKHLEKLKDQEQATLWDQENKKYFDYENNKSEQRKSKYKEYQQILKDQMVKKPVI